MKTFQEVIDLWRYPSVLAADIGAKPATVEKWRQRNEIPGRHWMAIAMAAKDRKFPLTVEILARIGAAIGDK